MVTASFRIYGLLFVLVNHIFKGEAKFCSCVQVADTIDEIRKGVLDAIFNQTKAICPDMWTRFQGSYYLFSSTRASFHDAELMCARQSGAHLVHVQSAKENTFLKSHMREMRNAGYWMGLTDASIEGVFVWYGTDVPTSFADWAPSQPSNWGGIEHCTQFKSSYNYAWNDQPCNSQLNFVCEKESN